MSEAVGKIKKSIKFALRQPGRVIASVTNRLTTEPSVFDNELGIAVIIKNEGPYIEEWVRYHLLVGAGIIYIYDNESTDNTRQILEPYINSGKVVYLEYLLDTIYRTPKNLLDLNKLRPWSQEMQAAFHME